MQCYKHYKNNGCYSEYVTLFVKKGTIKLNTVTNI